MDVPNPGRQLLANLRDERLLDDYALDAYIRLGRNRCERQLQQRQSRPPAMADDERDIRQATPLWRVGQRDWPFSQRSAKQAATGAGHQTAVVDGRSPEPLAPHALPLDHHLLAPISNVLPSPADQPLEMDTRAQDRANRSPQGHRPILTSRPRPGSWPNPTSTRPRQTPERCIRLTTTCRITGSRSSNPAPHRWLTALAQG